MKVVYFYVLSRFHKIGLCMKCVLPCFFSSIKLSLCTKCVLLLGVLLLFTVAYKLG
jgi:hypothetical protein